MSTPPLPTRSPFRIKPPNQESCSFSKFDPTKLPSPPLSPTSQEILEEIDRELKDTQERFSSAGFKGTSMDTTTQTQKLDYLSPMCSKFESGKRRDDEECTALEFLMAETKNEEDSSEHPIQFSSTYNDAIYPNCRMQNTMKYGINSKPMAKVLDGRSDRTSDLYTTILSYDGYRPSSSRYSVDNDEDDRAEAWLARGLLGLGREGTEHADDFARLGGVSPKTSFAHQVCLPSPLDGCNNAYGN